MTRARVIVSGSRHPLSADQMDFVRERMYWAQEQVAREHGWPLWGVGDAKGVDEYATSVLWELAPLIFNAEWDRLGRRAGPDRNRRMVLWATSEGGPAYLIAFPARDSRGTWDCIRQAVAAGMAVFVFPLPDSGRV